MSAPWALSQISTVLGLIRDRGQRRRRDPVAGVEGVPVDSPHDPGPPSVRFYWCRRCDIYGRAMPNVTGCWVCSSLDVEWDRYSTSCTPKAKATLLFDGGGGA